MYIYVHIVYVLGKCTYINNIVYNIYIHNIIHIYIACVSQNELNI